MLVKTEENQQITENKISVQLQIEGIPNPQILKNVALACKALGAIKMPDIGAEKTGASYDYHDVDLVTMESLAKKYDCKISQPSYERCFRLWISIGIHFVRIYSIPIEIYIPSSK